MNSIKAPGSEKWEPPSATSKAPISPNTQNQSRVAPVHSDKAQTDVQTLQKQHTLIGLLIGLAIIAVLIYGYLTISFANDLQKYTCENYYGDYVTVSADFTDTEIVISASTPFYTSLSDLEVVRSNYFVIAPGLVYISGVDGVGQICSMSIYGTILTISPGIITDDSSETWIG